MQKRKKDLVLFPNSTVTMLQVTYHWVLFSVLLLKLAHWAAKLERYVGLRGKEQTKRFVSLLAAAFDRNGALGSSLDYAPTALLGILFIQWLINARGSHLASEGTLEKHLNSFWPLVWWVEKHTTKSEKHRFKCPVRKGGVLEHKSHTS